MVEAGLKEVKVVVLVWIDVRTWVWVDPRPETVVVMVWVMAGGTDVVVRNCVSIWDCVCVMVVVVPILVVTVDVDMSANSGKAHPTS